ncbi:ABC transporter permease subunit [Halorientalis pallida]|uniref:Copper ABC transporter permease n=1 Tax=Halorientalis pallida TaxID=2479928 RepID=A0A498KTL6_9EURY|nr:ABC transporter permease subunit [Halorientalis pallida]RXK47455.1 copper ABC transporter permease [Halorientalis pallida]
MSWRVVAREDVYDAVRSKTTWLAVALFPIAFLGYVVAHDYVGEPNFPAFVAGLAGVVGVVLPAVAILLSYKSIADDRTSGRLTLTLSLPHSRRDLAIGTVVGRAVVVLVPALLALAVAGVVGAVRFGTDGVLWVPSFLLASALFGAAFVGFAVGLSMSTTADRWITLGGLGGYLLLVTFWGGLQSATLLVLHRFDFQVLRDIPDWALLFRLLEPGESYARLVRAGFDVDLAGLYVVEGAPLYVSAPAALVLLVAWALVPLVVGYRRFRASDL